MNAIAKINFLCSSTGEEAPERRVVLSSPHHTDIVGDSGDGEMFGNTSTRPLMLHLICDPWRVASGYPNDALGSLWVETLYHSHRRLTFRPYIHPGMQISQVEFANANPCLCQRVSQTIRSQDRGNSPGLTKRPYSRAEIPDWTREWHIMVNEESRRYSPLPLSFGCKSNPKAIQTDP